MRRIKHGYNGKIILEKRHLLKSYCGGKKYMKRIMHGSTKKIILGKGSYSKLTMAEQTIFLKTKYFPVNMLL